MKIEIKTRWSGSVLFSLETDNIKLCLEAAVRACANLRDAYLSGANLRDAKGVHPAICTPLLMLLDQPGPMRAYKLVTASGDSPIHDKKLNYKVGEKYEVKNPNIDVDKDCGSGINVATLDWCLHNWKEGYRVLIVEFTAADIAAIPTANDGKFRLYRCTVVAEKDISEIIAKIYEKPEVPAVEP